MEKVNFYQKGEGEPQCLNLINLIFDKLTTKKIKKIHFQGGGVGGQGKFGKSLHFYLFWDPSLSIFSSEYFD